MPEGHDATIEVCNIMFLVLYTQILKQFVLKPASPGITLRVSVSVSYSYRTNQLKNFNWFDFVMQYVIITLRQVIFSDVSTSGFKSELIIRS